MSSQRKIIHIDMDCFFAAVEMRDNPMLAAIPLAIGGSRSSRGVIATCNYPARAFGVRSAMPTGQALKLCPQLHLMAGNMEKYKTVSRQIRAIFHRYSDVVEPLSLDEAFLDVSNSQHFGGSATRIADDIRRVILAETGLTASAGVAPNKFLAKIASDENKPDGLFVITPQQVAAFVDNLPLAKIPGVGTKTAERLSRLGLTKCKDIANCDLAVLVKHFGAMADSLLKRSQGIDERPVRVERHAKSVGVEHTLATDIDDYPDCVEALSALWPKLQLRLEHQSDKGLQKIGVKLKFSDFRQTTVECQAQTAKLEQFLPLLQQAWQRRQQQGVRLVGIQLGFAAPNPGQLNLPF
ncbi:MAG: DNA polymerase IV [Rheinheimera sp.]|uniref:DNA polymerase IV n=1 Tax=Arsukibacterium sp. UBA3155 TaxID=1946058 RepID=UPI000C900B67|nr:DNA polymerase IV [Arsukibacterium sp. UBA3155]MAD77187.1 DNA polymerase IV [Rheinheimera sp.]|tara:strand:- start:38250 stop:39305 length:1056 start_codon:yes stop_codon:yes gene_type:complete